MKKMLLPVIILSLFLSGCWDLVESEKLGLVTLIGVDSADDQQVKVLIYEMSNPRKESGGQKGDSSGKPPVKLHEAVAPTAAEAVEKIIALDFRRTYFSHTYVIVLSEELVRSVGIRPFIDFFERTPEIRRNTWLLIAAEGQLGKIFNPAIASEPDADPGKVMGEIIRNKPSNSFISANTLGEFLNLLWETGSEPYTAGISLIKTDINIGKQDAGSDESNNYDLSIKNTAVFKKEKLVGWLDPIESKGLLWARGNIKGGTLAVHFGGQKLSLKIIRADSKIKPKIVDEKMEVDIRTRIISNLEDSRVNLDFANAEVIKNIQDLQAAEIKNQILAAYEKSKQLDSDVFGFGNYFFGKYPKVWKQMEASGFDYYRNIELKIEVDSKVNNIGLIKKATDIQTTQKSFKTEPERGGSSPSQVQQ